MRCLRETELDSSTRCVAGTEECPRDTIPQATNFGVAEEQLMANVCFRRLKFLVIPCLGPVSGLSSQYTAILAGDWKTEGERSGQRSRPRCK